MKHWNRIIALLCLVLVACMALPVAAPAALAEPALTADKTEVKLNKGEQTTVTLTFPHNGSFNCKWDNAIVANCVMSKVWNGYKTTMIIEGLAAGTTTVTLTNTVDDIPLIIHVTVVEKKGKQEIRTLMGKTVKQANKELANALKYAKKRYDNGSFRVTRNSLKRIKNITLYAGKGKYRLFSVYPGMKASSAAAKLKKQGWKAGRKSKKNGVTTVIYLNDTDPAHAIKLSQKSSKVTQVIYYVP